MLMAADGGSKIYRPAFYAKAAQVVAMAALQHLAFAASQHLRYSFGLRCGLRCGSRCFLARNGAAIAISDGDEAIASRRIKDCVATIGISIYLSINTNSIVRGLTVEN